MAHEERKVSETGGHTDYDGSNVYREKVITKTHFVENTIVISNTLYSNLKMTYNFLIFIISEEFIVNPLF